MTQAQVDDIKALALITKPDEVSSKLATLKNQGYQVLSIYTIHEPPALHRLSIKIVEPDYKIEKGRLESGDLYSRGGNKVGLQRPLYDKIGGAIGILWDWKACTYTLSPNGRRCEYRAVGHVRGMDGVWRTHMGDKCIDMDIIEQELRDKYQERRESFEWAAESGEGDAKRDGLDFCKVYPTPRDRDAWVAEKVRKDALQIQKHLVARAQSGAMNRAVEKIAGLRKTYDIKEIEKGFVFATLSFRPDPTNPQDREFMLNEASGANVLFRGGSREPAASQSPVTGPMTYDPVEAEDVEPIGEFRTRGAAPAEERPAPAPQEDPAPAEELPSKEESARADFVSADPMQQTTILKTLMKRKAYPESNIKGVMVKWSAVDRCKLYDHLLTLPDAGRPEHAEEGALPFATK